MPVGTAAGAGIPGPELATHAAFAGRAPWPSTSVLAISPVAAMRERSLTPTVWPNDFARCTSTKRRLQVRTDAGLKRVRASCLADGDLREQAEVVHPSTAVDDAAQR